MSPLSATLIANMPPPRVHVDIAPDIETLYLVATPLFLSLAVLFAGWWLVRSRTLATTAGRLAVQATMGSLAISYTSWWLWTNSGARGSNDFDAYLATDMPWFVFIVGMAVSVSGRIEGKKIAEARGIRTGIWRELLLAKMMVAVFVVVAFFGLIACLGGARYFYRIYYFLGSLWFASLVIWRFVLLGQRQFSNGHGNREHWRACAVSNRRLE